jgi:hypothetical protein
MRSVWLIQSLGKRKMPVLKCHKPTFYSQLDEEMFFTSLTKIAGVGKIEGRGWDLFFSVRAQPSEKALREMLGLFFRYKVDMRQLAQFLTRKNRAWFRSSDAYWFKKVFPAR